MDRGTIGDVARATGLTPKALRLYGRRTPEDVVVRVEDAVLAAGRPDNYAVVAVDLPAAGG